jgi:hypothetical protein
MPMRRPGHSLGGTVRFNINLGFIFKVDINQVTKSISLGRLLSSKRFGISTPLPKPTQKIQTPSINLKHAHSRSSTHISAA